MPEIGVLKVEQVRSIIRELFIKRIVDAKGLKNAERFIDSILMPTPTAVLNAAKLLAEGTPTESGLGEVAIVDIGGATTDIHSISLGAPTEPGVIQKGLPEPYIKRTVEGDLGMRYNASTIVQAVGKENFRKQMRGVVLDVEAAVESCTSGRKVSQGPRQETTLDLELARAAANLAMERHAGVIEVAYGPMGQYHIQYGKDLRDIKTVIGTGGPLVFGPNPEAVLKETLYSDAKPFSLKPKEPDFYIDEKYILYAIGLMAEVESRQGLENRQEVLEKTRACKSAEGEPPCKLNCRMSGGAMSISNRNAKRLWRFGPRGKKSILRKRLSITSVCRTRKGMPR